jgi:beta-phosphoglucomutase-like phosphatase (HAD superfamily)
MDGVLIDAREWHYESLNFALGLFGYEINRYDHIVTFDGLPTKRKLEMLSVEGGLPRKLHSFLNDVKQRKTLEIVYCKCKPKFIHQFALSKLKSENYKLALCSNSVRKSIEVMMEKSDLIQYLDFYLSNQDVVNSKPDPEMYIKAIEKLELHPLECLIVEDNENGIKAAKGSGAHYMQVSGPEDVTYDAISRKIKEIENA